MNTQNDWHTISAEETAKRLNVNPYVGLSEKEVRTRQSEYGKNRIWRITKTVPHREILNAAGDLSTILLLITAVLAFFFEEQREAVTMCVILAIGALLRIITYGKAKQILENNAAENIPSAAVLRGGIIHPISSVEIVPGDIVLLHPGDTVPCDGRVISDTDSIVSEAGITENRDQVHKYNTTILSTPGSAAIPCESRPNILYAGSMVLSGNPRMIASATGEDALISRKQGGIVIPAGDRLPLIEQLNTRCKVSELFMLSLVVVLSVLSLFVNPNIRLSQAFIASVSTAAASMSEYLTAIGFIIIAIAAQTSPKQKRKKKKEKCPERCTIIKDCSKIENIASANSVIIGDISLMKSGKAVLDDFFLNGTIHRKGEDIRQLSAFLSLAAGVVGLGEEKGSLAEENGDTPLTERESLLRQAGILFAEATAKSPFRPIHIIERTNSASTDELDTAIFLSASTKKPYAAAVGSVQSVLRCCTAYRTEKGILPLTNEIKKQIFTETAHLEYMGAKILAAAIRPSPTLTLEETSSVLTEMYFEGFFSVSEMPSDGVLEAVRELKDAEKRIILLSSNPEHDLYYGHSLGLFNKKTKTVPHTCPKEILKTEQSLIVTVPPYTHTNTEADLAASAARYRVVKHAGKNTAFLTKDSLDARALSVSDCGIAISSSERKAASQSLKNHAPVVVYSGNEEEYGGFAGGVSAMREGRRALINMANASFYLTASQLSRLFLLLSGIVLGLTVPTPAAVLASGILLDFGAVLVMAFEKAPRHAFSIPCEKLPTFTKQIGKTVLFGLLSAVLSVSVPHIVNIFAPRLHISPLTSKGAVSLLSACLFLSQLTLASQFMNRCPLIRRRITVNLATVCYDIAVLSATAMILFWKKFSAFIGGSPVPLSAALFALLPSFVLFIIMEVGKRLKKSKK